MCEKIRDFGVKRVGVGRRGEMGRKWSESPRNSGRLTFYKTAVLSQVLVLSIYVAFFLALVIIWSHGISNRPGSVFNVAGSETTLSEKACDLFRTADTQTYRLFNQSILELLL